MPLGIQKDDTLETWLATCAHTISARALVSLAGAGALLVSAAWLWRNSGTWPLTAVGLCSVAFSAWALADQRLETMSAFAGDRRTRITLLSLRVARRTAAVVGVMSGAALLMSVPVVLLGNWIS